MVEVAARRKQDRRPFAIELAEVAPLVARERSDLRGSHDPAMAAPEDELALAERSAREHAAALAAGVLDLDVPDHG
jgi:hypothetical protein